jgi:hypothetical protein
MSFLPFSGARRHLDLRWEIETALMQLSSNALAQHAKLTLAEDEDHLAFLLGGGSSSSSTDSTLHASPCS